MCRFLLVRSKKELDPRHLLHAFADMSKASKDSDGDPQKDGWGVAWRNGKDWHILKSLNPIWIEKNKLEDMPQTHIFAAHARSASFPQFKGTTDYNEPFINDDICFVYNGRLYGVAITRQLKGNIGAQKIFSLLSDEMENTQNMKEALKSVRKIVSDHTRRIQANNIGVILNDKLFALCQYGEFPDYFTIRYYQDENIAIVCSEPILSYNWKSMKKGEILEL